MIPRYAIADHGAFAESLPLSPVEKNWSQPNAAELFGRGSPTVLRGSDLRFVGMPVSGITTGQMYLGGDGRLWHWDIFNHYTYTDSDHYAHPPQPQSPLIHGFRLHLGDRSIPVDRTGFSDVSFRGEYPIGTVNYKDVTVPIAIKLEAYSPFTPLALADSSLPVTLLEFTLTNTSNEEREIGLTGELENAVCRFSSAASIHRRNRFIGNDSLTFLECSGEEVEGSRASDITLEDWSPRGGLGWTGTVKVTSRPFKVDAPYLNFKLGGELHPFPIEVKLLLEGRIVRATAIGNESRRDEGFDVADLIGQTVQLEINPLRGDRPLVAGMGTITLSDRPWHAKTVSELPDFGTMGLGLLGSPAEIQQTTVEEKSGEKRIGRVGRTLRLRPKETATVTFVLAWSFPNLWLAGQGRVGRHYATRFSTAHAAADYVAGELPRLARETKLWRDTWYDSTLPYWLLDRTMASTSTLATSTSLRFANGNFWAWEGVGNCPGTCLHVWGYGQSTGRLFPELEEILRTRVDFDSAMSSDGRIGFRGLRPTKVDAGNWAVDGQSMVILRTLRQHHVSPDNSFLRRVWPKARMALEALIAIDRDKNGILQGPQHNTLDSEWYGRVAWLSGLYQAALRAGEEMAKEMGDKEFADRCRALFARGQVALVDQLFDGDYFINRIDPAHADSINSGTGCLIDQMLGQSWAHQVNLGRTIPEATARKALQALWRYNFKPDVGPYRSTHRAGRWLAMPGEAGLLMCTFPRRDWDFDKAAGTNSRPEFVGYLNECMNGFEYQVASHMIWEGMVREGLLVTRAVHDRYAASRRNPWNEIEWGDHYGRSTASYGVFLAACGFEYHGPKGHLGFDPQLTSEEFRTPFTGSAGWGTYTQKATKEGLRVAIDLKWGKLDLTELHLRARCMTGDVIVTLGDRPLTATLTRTAERCAIRLVTPATLVKGDKLQVILA